MVADRHETAWTVPPTSRKEPALTPTASILVLANRTAPSAGLEQALRQRQAQGPVTFTLLIPLGASAGARATAESVAEQLREAGLDVRGVVGDADPLRAVMEIYSPADFDEIIVSTLPEYKSRWMRSDLPARIERHTGALVHHVQATEHHAPDAPLTAAVSGRGGRT